MTPRARTAAPAGMWRGRAGQSATRVRAEVGAVSTVVGAALLAGVAVGCAWAWTTPKVVQIVGEPAVVDPGTGAGLNDPTMEIGRFFIGEGFFAVYAVVAGIVVARVALRSLHTYGAVVAVALAAGGFLGSLVAWRVGVWLGPGAVDVTSLAVGDDVARPLRLRSSGLLVVWSIVSVLIALWSVALRVDQSGLGQRPDGA